MFPRGPTKFSIESPTQSLLSVWIGSCEPGVYGQAGTGIELICLARGVDGV